MPLMNLLCPNAHNMGQEVVYTGGIPAYMQGTFKECVSVSQQVGGWSVSAVIKI